MISRAKVLCLSIWGHLVVGQSIFDFESSIRYGNFLMKNNAHRSAIIEYERASYLSKLPDSTRFRLAVCYYKVFGKKHALQTASLSITDTSYFLKKVKYLFSEYSNSTLAAIIKDSTLTTLQKSMLSSDLHLLNSSWDKSIAAMQANPDLNNSFKAIRYPVAIEGLQIKKKSPTKAALFSALIPGSGKLYTGEWRDGLFSLVLLAGSVFSTWRAGELWGYANPWTITLASIGTGFYLGNIYGSYHSAIKVNEMKNKKLQSRVENIIFSIY